MKMIFSELIYLDKNYISLTSNNEHYLKIQRGFFYDFESIFSGEISLNFNELMEAISNADKPYTDKQIKKLKN